MYVRNNLRENENVDAVRMIHMDRWPYSLPVGFGHDVDVWATTERHPLRIAASWGNRGRFKPELIDKYAPLWARSWDSQEMFNLHRAPLIFRADGFLEQHGFAFDGAPVNEHPDTYGLHAALDRGDMEHFTHYVPDYLLEGLPEWHS